MTGRTHTKAWVPLRDYLVKGVRPARVPPAQTVSEGVPSGWVSAWDYWVAGVRKPRQIDERDSVMVLKPPRPPKVVPPEAWLTTDDVIADIQVIFSHSLMPLKVEEMQFINHQEVEQGDITEEEFQYRTVRLEEIQEEHFVRIEEIVQWYLDNYFRELSTDGAASAAH
ncbi:MAG: hypothetical protein H7838_06940 [Magnetococcus sp. DMHC-8]